MMQNIASATTITVEMEVAAVGSPDGLSMQKLIQGIAEQDLPIWSILFINPRMVEMKNVVPLMEHNGHAAEEPDSLIDVDAAAQRLSVSTDWIYRNARKLPFTVRQGRLLRFSTSGINRYIGRRQGV